MGDGLKRAFAATARTRCDGVLTPVMRSFLAALPGGGRSVTVKDLPMHADRAQDRARQACRRLGRNPTVEELLLLVPLHDMTPEEIQAQRESWARANIATGDPRFD